MDIEDVTGDSLRVVLFPSGKATITFALSSALNISRLTKQEGTAS
jgi:hypothetical protein